MIRNTLGITRTVFLSKNYVFKVPCMRYGWRIFLNGLLANIQEKSFGTAGLQGMCPVLWGDRFGFLIIMPRCEENLKQLSDEEYNKFINRENYIIPVENKADSFGILNGELVAVDYGS